MSRQQQRAAESAVEVEDGDEIQQHYEEIEKLQEHVNTQARHTET